MGTQTEILWERAKKVSPGGVHSPVRAFRGVGGTPSFIKSAKGPHLFDEEGNRLVDFCMSWGPLLFGHQPPTVKAAVAQALDRGWTFGTCEAYSLELAELITNNVPWVEKIRFVNSGTEAVMSALRVARAVTGRNKILKFTGCYHGHVDSMLVKAGSGLADMPNPDSAGVSESVASETLVCPLNDEAALKTIFDVHGDEIAAVILEPIPANNGLLPQRVDWLKHLEVITRKNNSLLIFDEVISGFRMAFGGMAERLGMTPDLVTYGKVIGGGFPVGGYGGKAELMNWVAPTGPVYQAGTLSANPVAMVAGLETLRLLKEESPYAALEQKGLELEKLLKEVCQEKGRDDIQLQREGSLFWSVIHGQGNSPSMVRNPDDIPEMHAESYKHLYHRLRQRGIYLAPSAYEVGFLSTVHETEHLQMLAAALSDSLDEEQRVA